MEQVINAKAALDAAQEARREAMAQRDAAVVSAIADGHKRKLIAETLGVTQARISEIWTAAKQAGLVELEESANTEAATV